MAIPRAVRNRLQLGGALAAELAADDSGGRTWVYVEPVVWTGGDLAGKLDQWQRLQAAGGKPDAASGIYHIRCIHLTRWHLDAARDLRSALRERPVPDERLEVRGEAELEKALLRWLPDLNDLRAPEDARYPHPPYRY